MAARSPPSDLNFNLALSLVEVSTLPVLLLDSGLRLVAASASFCRAFSLDPEKIRGRPIFEMGGGEWNVPQLGSLLNATGSGQALVGAYEMDLHSPSQGTRRLVLEAHRLGDQDAAMRLLLTISDVTEVRATDKRKDDLLREKTILLQELQHRIANSLQIISSVILQSARRARTEEARGHLREAHERVMSVAQVQRHLDASTLGDVALRPYFTQLCQSLAASMIRDPGQLAIDADVKDVSVAANASVSLGLIVTELVINALKHAFPNRRRGVIRVSYWSEGADWTLSVSDNGIGMPVDPATAIPGLGTNIVEALAKQLGAVVEVVRVSPGTVVSIIGSVAVGVGQPGGSRSLT